MSLKQCLASRSSSSCIYPHFTNEETNSVSLSCLPEVPRPVNDKLGLEPVCVYLVSRGRRDASGH